MSQMIHGKFQNSLKKIRKFGHGQIGEVREGLWNNIAPVQLKPLKPGLYWAANITGIELPENALLRQLSATASHHYIASNYFSRMSALIEGNFVENRLCCLGILGFYNTGEIAPVRVDLFV